MDAQAARPPFGDLMTADHDLAIRYHTTSGTSGRVPFQYWTARKTGDGPRKCGRTAFGALDTHLRSCVFCILIRCLYRLWGAHYGCEKIGTLVLASGGSSTEHRIKTLIDSAATTVCCTPTYALRLWQTAGEMGLDLAKDSKVNKLILSGEPAGSSPRSNDSSRKRGEPRSAIQQV